MFYKLARMIHHFLKLNPTPSDHQFHQLAEACGIDKETMESVAYAMLALMDKSQDEGKEKADDKVVLRSAKQAPIINTVDGVDPEGVPYDELTDAQLADDGRVSETHLPYYDAALPDGSLNERKTTQVQRDTHDDGGFEAFDKSMLRDDGYIVPDLKRLVSRLRKMS